MIKKALHCYNTTDNDKLVLTECNKYCLTLTIEKRSGTDKTYYFVDKDDATALRDYLNTVLPEMEVSPMKPEGEEPELRNVE